MPVPLPVGVNIADRELHPQPPAMGLFCNWEGVNGSLGKFLTKGLRKSELACSRSASLQCVKPCTHLDQEPGGLGPLVTRSHHSQVFFKQLRVHKYYAEGVGLCSHRRCSHLGRSKPSFLDCHFLQLIVGTEPRRPNSTR